MHPHARAGPPTGRGTRQAAPEAGWGRLAGSGKRRAGRRKEGRRSGGSARGAAGPVGIPMSPTLPIRLALPGMTAVVAAVGGAWAVAGPGAAAIAATSTAFLTTALLLMGRRAPGEVAPEEETMPGAPDRLSAHAHAPDTETAPSLPACHGDEGAPPPLLAHHGARVLSALAGARAELRLLCGRLEIHGDDRSRELVASALRAVEEAAGEARIARTLAERLAVPARRLDAALLAAQVVEGCRALLGGYRASVQVVAPEPVPVDGRPDALAEILQAMIREGLEACAASTRPGRIEVRVHRAGDLACVEVADTGRVVRLLTPSRPEPGGRAASPFAPGGPLALARALARAHGGDLRLAGRDPRLEGARRMLLLPLARAEAANEAGGGADVTALSA